MSRRSLHESPTCHSPPLRTSLLKTVQRLKLAAWLTKPAVLFLRPKVSRATVS